MAAVVVVDNDSTFCFPCNTECHSDVAYSRMYPKPKITFNTNYHQIPLQAWLVALTRLLYDRELAVLERSVKPASVLQNASLILGKQIIHILPEGYSLDLS